MNSDASPPGFGFERALWRQGYRRVAGIDEAGRGPLAGPVVAAAVVVPEGFVLDGVDDSKKLPPEKREEIFALLCSGAADVGVGIIGHEVIDEINILNATFRAMHAAVRNLSLPADYLLVDGNRFTGGPLPYAAIVKGDARCFSIAAASIVAKVSRDRLMIEYDCQFPGYGFAQHKGYGTPEHRDAIARLGRCPIHRRSFHLHHEKEAAP